MATQAVVATRVVCLVQCGMQATVVEVHHVHGQHCREMAAVDNQHPEGLSGRWAVCVPRGCCIRHIQRGLRITAPFVTHDQTEAAELADRIAPFVVAPTAGFPAACLH